MSWFAARVNRTLFFENYLTQTKFYSSSKRCTSAVSSLLAAIAALSPRAAHANVCLEVACEYSSTEQQNKGSGSSF